MIVDVDAHFEPGLDWADERPDLKEALSGRFPESDPRYLILQPSDVEVKLEQLGVGLCGHVQRNLPAQMRMDYRKVATEHHERREIGAYDEHVYEGAEQDQVLQPAKRLEWLNKVGIDVQNLVNVLGMKLMQKVENVGLGHAAIKHLNTWMSDRLDGYRDRQMLVASCRYEDMDWAIAELTRMRERGCRAFIIPGEPIGYLPPYDEYYDRLYDAAVDLGMVAMMHVGSGPAFWHPGWGNTTNPQMIRWLGGAGSYQNASLMLNAMIFGGVFERHPKFTLQISEFGVGWIPFTVQNMDARASKGGERTSGPYPYSLKPSEFMSRNVRISGLPGQNPIETLNYLPKVAVFSSDYPHYEGHPDPLTYYTPIIASAPEDRQEQYWGGAMEESYKMMGDPLQVPR
jgi:predicted TIM-barrel fold metal-dependent hydrolase